jgi:hypothetical protein
VRVPSRWGAVGRGICSAASLLGTLTSILSRQWCGRGGRFSSPKVDVTSCGTRGVGRGPNQPLDATAGCCGTVDRAAGSPAAPQRHRVSAVRIPMIDARRRCTLNSSALSDRSRRLRSRIRSGIVGDCNGCMVGDGGASARGSQRFVSPMGSCAKPKSIGTRRLELVEESCG